LISQKILNEIVRSNTFYHARALQLLAAPCVSVHKIASPGDTTEVKTPASLFLFV
jgi:hypothetical protein